MAKLDRYWDLIKNPDVLRRAAQIVANDSYADFQEANLERQIFSYSRDEVINEIVAALESDRYMPEPKIKQSIPKSNYSQRPGSVISYRDRVLCQAIIMCIAPILDAQLIKNVWSWRLKSDAKSRNPQNITKTGLFRETDISKFPFLKKSTVRKHFDDFEPWYRLWPEFDRVTNSVLRGRTFKFMVVSDIAGYFENIELSVLHKLLMRYLSDAPKTLNLLMRHFDVWVDTLHDGSRVDRGIPQGNSISSFVGNFYLKPIDDAFSSDKNLKYFRYVDDIRILTRTESDARLAALKLEERIRDLKLNLQSAKTKVVSSVDGLKLIHDDRLDRLDQAQGMVNRSQNKAALTILNSVRDMKGTCVHPVPIKGSRPPLTDLNLRVFRRWAGLHLKLGSPEPIERMCKEATENANFAVLRDLQKIARSFPLRKMPPNSLWKHILAGGCMFPMQEAELVRILRSFAHVPDSAYLWACKKVRDIHTMPYLRMQSVFLLSRSPCFWPKGAEIVDTCLSLADTRSITSGIVASCLNDPRRIRLDIARFEKLASPDAMRLIQYLRALRKEPATRENLLGYVFGTLSQVENRMYEFSYLLRFIATGEASSRAAFQGFVRGIERKARLSLPAKTLIGFLKNV